VHRVDEPTPFTTEAAWGTKTPTFNTPFTIIPRTVDLQLLRFVLLKLTPMIKPIEEYEVLGEAEIPLGRILVHNGVCETMKGGLCDIRISVSQAARGRGVLSLVVAFAGMPKDHWLHRNYPQLVVCKSTVGTNEWTPVFTTQIVKRSEAGQWPPFALPCALLCDNDYTRRIRLLVQDAEPRRPVVGIGYVDVQVQAAGEARNWHMGLIPSDPKVARAGSIIIRAGNLVERLTFFGHVQRGLRFGLAVAIDFSSGNRPMSDPKSLHYIVFKHPNAYERIIEAIGMVVEQYSATQTCYAWGFAAKLKRQLSQAIPITNEAGSSALAGVHQLLTSYAALVEKLQFDGPIHVTPTLEEAVTLVRAAPDWHEYLLFLILLHDDPSDLPAFLQCLWRNQKLPFTVLIIGVGSNRFPLLSEKFRSGSVQVDDQGREYDRELVKFIKYAEYRGENIAQMVSLALFTLRDEAVRWMEDTTPL
jgi:hypothetical protein